MIAALAHHLAPRLARRSARERFLLALLLGVALPAAFVFLVALPLLDQRDAARAQQTEAQALRAWYVARQPEIAGLPDSATTAVQAGAGAAVPVGLGGLEDRLIDAGLRAAVKLLANTQGDGISLVLADVRFEALMDWIDGVEAEAGYALSALRLERGTDGGLVDADLRLETRP